MEIRINIERDMLLKTQASWDIKAKCDRGEVRAKRVMEGKSILI